MKKVIKMLMLLFALTGLISTEKINASDIKLDSPTRGESYIIGLDDTFAPMGFRDEQGNLVGFDIDLANAMAELYDWNLTFQPIDWSLKETELNSGNIDMIWNGYGVTPEREEKVIMSEPYIVSRPIIVSKKESGLEELENLEGKKIATQSGSTSMDFMKAWPNDLFERLDGEPTLYPDYNQVFADLAADRVDAIYTGILYGAYTLNQRDDSDQYTYFIDPTSEEPMAVGLRKSDTVLKEAIDQGLAYLRESGDYNEIYIKWFGEPVEAEQSSLLIQDEPTDSISQEMAVDADESEGAIDMNKPLEAPIDSPTQGESYIIGLDDTFAPMGFRDEQGNLVGLDIDLATEIAAMYDWDLTFQPIDWSLKETELNSGNIDMIWNGYGVTPEREEKVLMSEPYIVSVPIIVSKKGSGLEELEDLEGKKIATQSGSTSLDFMKAWPNDLFERLDGEPTLYPDYNQVFADLASDRVDAIYTGILYGAYTLNQRDDSDLYTYFIDPTSEEPMAVGLRKSDTDLKEAIDAGINALKESGRYDAIYTKWLGEPVVAASSEQSEPTEETTQNETWLEETIRLMPALLDGLKMTLLIFVVVLLLSIPLGFIVGILRVFGPKWLQAIIEGYVFIMRGSPLMLQLMLIFFGLPFIGISLDRLPAALLAFVINYVAYLAEIFRGGISSVPKGQYESIEVLGIGQIRGFRRIILPQVFKIVMPSIGNEVISLVKDTSLVYVIGIGEVLRASSIAANREASLLPYVLAGVIYLILTGILTYLLRKVEFKLEW